MWRPLNEIKEIKCFGKAQSPPLAEATKCHYYEDVSNCRPESSSYLLCYPAGPGDTLGSHLAFPTFIKTESHPCCCQHHVERFLLKFKNHLSSPWEHSDCTGNNPLSSSALLPLSAPSRIITYNVGWLGWS